MQALMVHKSSRPPLRRGTALLPIRSWHQAHAPRQILRSSQPSLSLRRSPYLTLVHVPDDHVVAIVVGAPDDDLAELTFSPLNALATEDREALDEHLAGIADAVPNLSRDGIGWLAWLVLGEALPRSAIKWTKDERVLREGTRNASTKRRGA